MKKVITFLGADSKTGTSMVSQSVAETLVKGKERVLYISASGEYGDSYLPNDIIGGLDELKGNDVLTDDFVRKVISNKNGLSFISGAKNLTEVKRFKPSIIKNIVKAIHRDYDYIVIDGGNDVQFPLPIGSILCADEIYYVFSPNEKTVKKFGYSKDMMISQNINEINIERKADGKGPIKEFAVVNKVTKKMATYSKEQIGAIFNMPAFDLPFIDGAETYELERKTFVGQKLFDKALAKLVEEIKKDAKTQAIGNVSEEEQNNETKNAFIQESKIKTSEATQEDEKEFFIDEFLGLTNQKVIKEVSSQEITRRFEEVCDIVSSVLDQEWEVFDDKAKERRIEQEKRAIIGYTQETEQFKAQIREILREKNLSSENYPSYYPTLEEAVFAELFGLSGLTPWAYDMTPEYKASSSAKLIGERLYCLIDGKSQLQPQIIPKRRREQLKRALLLSTPKERLEDGFHEVYLHNGIRITIFSGERTKDDQDIIVFRKYVLKDLSFDKMVELETIPKEAAELFELMVKIGYNTVMAGQVRSGKTTFMQTWQSYEDPTLEGLAIATDPETPWHKIMPNAPIMQLVIEDDQLDGLTKSLLRGDQDYVLLEEMRNAPAFRTFLSITSTGTQRSKGTIHDNNAINIPYKMASEIQAMYGGNQDAIIAQCYRNINYVLEFYQVPDNKAKKKLKGVVEFRYDYDKDTVSAHRICDYDASTNTWRWKYDLGSDKEKLSIGYENEIRRMKELLKELEMKSPIKENHVTYPAYYKGNVTRKEG